MGYRAFRDGGLARWSIDANRRFHSKPPCRRVNLQYNRRPLLIAVDFLEAQTLQETADGRGRILLCGS